MNSPVALVAQSLSIFLNIYFVLIIVRVLLSWFPNIDWYAQPFATVSQLTDPYLNLFRSFIPPIGGLDISPILAIFVLQFATQALTAVAATTATTMPF
ncbi:YggT family protein [Leptolyngbya sp. AN02str]|uniref:YggT family protein n=1 Tax=Leptolyngbya sp. AN02str TaxID=3423363 RepID=UPI003D3197CE